MAKLDLNPAVGSIRGRIDGWVYRSLNGQTVVSPFRGGEPKPLSAAQSDHRERFRAAQAYAAAILADPVKRRVYQKLGAERRRPPNALLISNFLTPPTIESVEVEGYRGEGGPLIQVLATDAIEVTEVGVEIRDAGSGAILESGPAIQDHGVWLYRTRAAVGATALAQIEITARNRAGTEAKQILTHGPW